MTIYPAAGALLIIWAWLALRDGDDPMRLTIALLPFGMFAAIDAGGLSLLAAHLIAALTLCQVSLRWFSAKGLSRTTSVPPSGIALLLFALYAAFAATVLVRFFAGQFLIFPMAVSRAGIPVSVFFPSTMAPLAPSNSNIAQTLYILLSCLVFFCAHSMARRRGLRFAEGAVVWAAVVNLVLSLVDLAALDTLLSVVRTAHYTLNNHHTMAGMPRVIGGFSEASGLGAFSAGLFAYFAMSYLMLRRSRDGALAFAMLACTFLSLSSSGIVSAFAGFGFLALHYRAWFGQGLSRAFGHWFVILSMAALVAIALLLLNPAITDTIGKTLDDLMFSKADSSSGLERTAWARSGFDAFWRSNGLGVGPGSLRSNGLVAVLLGTTGLPGVLCFFAFLWLSFAHTPSAARREAQSCFLAARVSALTLLTAMLLSATTPDPTLHLTFLAGLAVAARDPQTLRQRLRPQELRPSMAEGGLHP